MFDRVVSVCSLMLAITSVVFFGLGAWWILVGKMGQGDGALALTGWLLAAIVFAYRSADPAYLDPVSIVNAR
jgi:hypothetical protein